MKPGHDHGYDLRSDSRTLGTITDPVCGKTVDPDNPRGGSTGLAGRTYYFCSDGCRRQLVEDPASFEDARFYVDSANLVTHSG